jgi:hypothetical protein
MGKQARDKSARKERAESRLGRLLAVAIVFVFHNVRAPFLDKGRVNGEAYISARVSLRAAIVA